jgi:hypothetical protein
VLGGHRVWLHHHIRVGNNLLDPLGHLLSITKTCRQTHSDASLIFFELNAFGGEDLHPYQRGYQEDFVDALSAPQRLAIKYWFLDHCHFNCIETIPNYIGRLPGLQRYTIVAMESDFDTAVEYLEKLKGMVKNSASREVEVLLQLYSA